jgi:hypothetical protein
MRIAALILPDCPYAGPALADLARLTGPWPTGEALAALRPGLTLEMATAVSKIIRIADLIAVEAK